MAREYPWYETANPEEGITQGEIIRNCPVVIPPDTIDLAHNSIDVKVRSYDVIIMSQACDLENQKLDVVVVCGLWKFSDFEGTNQYFKSKAGKEALRRGNVPGYNLLNKCDLEGAEFEFSVVDFRNIFGLPFNFLTQFTKTNPPRVRLLPPYREHLSQAFARYFMRVGLPVDIPSFS
ncbi:hypothetical protein [Candidatus Chloroploca sp. Khr17]|uniref:hypothetical protein n=1 Tax=Candidatus Chloroploca sp. Khr17 TaxID=2496869 RepID=UPI00101CA797|nr:hypothetical protein [Candidatus Chloroploca sp. Khr17]